MAIHRDLMVSVDCDACSMQHCDAQLPSIIIAQEKIYSIVMNSWVTFLKQWSAEHNMPYGQASNRLKLKQLTTRQRALKQGTKEHHPKHTREIWILQQNAVIRTFIAKVKTCARHADHSSIKR